MNAAKQSTSAVTKPLNNTTNSATRGGRNTFYHGTTIGYQNQNQFSENPPQTNADTAVTWDNPTSGQYHAGSEWKVNVSK